MLWILQILIGTQYLINIHKYNIEKHSLETTKHWKTFMINIQTFVEIEPTTSDLYAYANWTSDELNEDTNCQILKGLITLLVFKIKNKHRKLLIKRH